MGTTKKCPYCGEEIMADARKCRHCGEWLDDETEKKESENQPKNEVAEEIKPDEGSQTETIPNKSKVSLFRSCFWEQLTKHYWDFEGKIDRKTYWVYCLYACLIMEVEVIISLKITEIAIMSFVLPWIALVLVFASFMVMILPTFGLTVRRLHDIGKKGAWYFISFVPYVGIIWLTVLLLKKGETRNPKRWNWKDTIITIAMVAVITWFFVPVFTSVYTYYKENNFDSELSLVDEMDIKNEIRQIPFGLNVMDKPLSSFMDEGLKSVYGEVQAKEKEYNVECECLDIVRLMEYDHVEFVIIECGAGLLDNEAYADVKLKFENNPDVKATLFLTYERKKSFFSAHTIENVLIEGIVFNDDWNLILCMKEWLESERYSYTDFVYEVDEFGNEYLIGEDGIGYYRGNVYDDEDGRDNESEDYDIVFSQNTDYVGEYETLVKVPQPIEISNDIFEERIIVDDNNASRKVEEGEDVEKEDVQEQEIFQVVEQMPEFPGGEGKLMEYVAQNINYPQIARETGIQGRVFVGFVIEPDGSVSNVKLLRGIGGGCDEEAIRVVKSLPRWKPGKNQGKAVRVSYQIPVFFKLQ